MNLSILTNKKLILLVVVFSLTSCGSIGRLLNPFRRTPPPEAFLGEPTDHALATSKNKAEEARMAFKSMGEYQRQHTPSPNKPVIQPSIVRVMWIPDHITTDGDLIPAHYYYLKVLNERWSVTDAFDIKDQLNSPGGRTPKNGSGLPFISR